MSLCCARVRTAAVRSVCPWRRAGHGRFAPRHTASYVSGYIYTHACAVSSACTSVWRGRAPCGCECSRAVADCLAHVVVRNQVCCVARCHWLLKICEKVQVPPKLHHLGCPTPQHSVLPPCSFPVPLTKKKGSRPKKNEKKKDKRNKPACSKQAGETSPPLMRARVPDPMVPGCFWLRPQAESVARQFCWQQAQRHIAYTPHRTLHRTSPRTCLAYTKGWVIF